MCAQYYQVISMLEVALNLEFPPLMNELANGASVSNLDAFAIVPTGCAFAMNTHDKLFLFSFTIVVTGAVVGAWSVIKKKSLFKTYLIALSFILPTVTRLIFTTFPCVEVDTGERWLVADKSISCDDEGELCGRRANSAFWAARSGFEPFVAHFGQLVARLGVGGAERNALSVPACEARFSSFLLVSRRASSTPSFPTALL